MKLIRTKGSGARQTAETLAALEARGGAALDAVLPAVRRIVTEVRRQGDRALLRYAAQFDGLTDAASLRITPDEMAAAWEAIDPALREALSTAAEQIRAFAVSQLPASWCEQSIPGLTTGQLVRALGSVGCYVPSGRHPLPSTLLMTAIPAQVAGVERIVVVSPKPAPDAAAVNTTLPDGMRIAAIFPPVADRLCVAIRRPVASGKTIDDLVEEHVISPEMRQVLDACVATRQNILVSGDRAACDSLLRAILWSVDRVARVALLSDSIAPPASATSWIKLQPEAQAADLVTAAVAMQPEYLIVDAKHSSLDGEVLGECNLGLEGVILAIVARSTNDALHRMQLLSSAQGSAATIGADIVASSVDLIVQASVLADGSLKVVEIAEPKASLDGQLSAHALLTWIPGDDNAGSFTVTGARSALATKLSSAGSSIPTEILNRQ